MYSLQMLTAMDIIDKGIDYESDVNHYMIQMIDYLMEVNDIMVFDQYVVEKIISGWTFGKVDDIRLYLLSKDGMIIAFYDPSTLTHEECHVAVAQNGLAIEHVPQYLMTEEIAIKAMNQNGLALQYIEFTNQTFAICDAAVRDNGMSLLYASPSFVDDEMRWNAVCSNPDAIRIIAIPNRNHKICMKAVMSRGILLEFVPFNSLNDYYECSMIAVFNDPVAIIKLNVPLQFLKFFHFHYTMAIIKIPHLIQHVSDIVLTQRLCDMAVRLVGYCLRWIPLRFHNDEMYNVAILRNPMTIVYIPPEKRSREICERVYMRDIDFIVMLYPNHPNTRDDWKRIMAQLIRFIPMEYRSLDICRKAYEMNDSIANEIPTIHRNTLGII